MSSDADAQTQKHSADQEAGSLSFCITLLNGELIKQPVTEFETIERQLHTKFDATQYIKTKTGNIVSRRSVLHGSQRILLAGKSTLANNCVIRGDLSTLRIGPFCFLGSGSLLRPPSKQLPRTIAFLPMTLGSHIFIGKNTIIEAAKIGDHVIISDDCVVSDRCILQDCCVLLPGTILPPDTIVPPFSVFAGHPARQVADVSLPESFIEIQKHRAERLYDEIAANLEQK